MKSRLNMSSVRVEHFMVMIQARVPMALLHACANVKHLTRFHATINIEGDMPEIEHDMPTFARLEVPIWLPVFDQFVERLRKIRVRKCFRASGIRAIGSDDLGDVSAPGRFGRGSDQVERYSAEQAVGLSRLQRVKLDFVIHEVFRERQTKKSRKRVSSIFRAYGRGAMGHGTKDDRGGDRVDVQTLAAAREVSGNLHTNPRQNHELYQVLAVWGIVQEHVMARTRGWCG
ncbi:hypothetical protein BGZ93_000233 [Podila epicladia]|nr:hypothetical protein BGZ93_000233 [Podila epicladia]